MTINEIRDAMSKAGSHWFDRGTLAFFKSKIDPQVYQGSGGVYFVSSEEDFSGKREWAVRQFTPDPCSINPISHPGPFETKNAAHKAAKALAGPDAKVESQAFRPPTAPEQLALDINRNGGDATVKMASRLIMLAAKHHRLMEDACNGTVELFDSEGNQRAPLKTLRAQIVKTATTARCLAVRFSGDPRGATVKLVLPSGATNDFGKEGWCVPTMKD